jgi:hypothetical protein
VKRLKSERVGFDNQLAALERTLQAKQRDYEELLFLSGDANHAREVSQQELQRVKGAYEEERGRRETELRERHQVVQLRKNMFDRATRREAKRQEIVDKAIKEDGVDGEGEVALRTSMSAGGLGLSSPNGMTSGEHMEAHKVSARGSPHGLRAHPPLTLFVGRLACAQSKQKIDIFENAFRKIKEATGVSDVNEVIQKIEGQEGTSANLMALTKENQARIESITENRETLKKNVEEVKYSSRGGGHRRKLVDDKEESLNTAVNVLERWRARYVRAKRAPAQVGGGRVVGGFQLIVPLCEL